MKRFMAYRVRVRKPAATTIRAKAPAPNNIRKESVDANPSPVYTRERMGLVSTMLGFPSTERKGATEATPAVSRRAIITTIPRTSAPRLRSLGVRSLSSFLEGVTGSPASRTHRRTTSTWWLHALGDLSGNRFHHSPCGLVTDVTLSGKADIYADTGGVPQASERPAAGLRQLQNQSTVSKPSIRVNSLLLCVTRMVLSARAVPLSLIHIS